MSYAIHYTDDHGNTHVVSADDHGDAMMASLEIKRGLDTQHARNSLAVKLVRTPRPARLGTALY